MLPILPESHAPAPPEAPRRPHPNPPRLLVLYCVAGAVSGAIDGGIAAGIACAYKWWSWRGAGPNLVGGLRGRLGPEFIEDFAAPVAGGIFGGLCTGIACGLILWMIVASWPAGRHPVRAASLCGSLGGTLCLIMFSGRINLEAMLGLAAVVLLGAIFGFLTSWLARFMDRKLDTIRA